MVLYLFPTFAAGNNNVMAPISFESYKKRLMADIQHATDYDSLQERLLDAQMEMDSSAEAETDEELLVKILKISHRNVMDGKSYSQEEVERFLDQRFYELEDKVVGTCVAESL